MFGPLALNLIALTFWEEGGAARGEQWRFRTQYKEVVERSFTRSVSQFLEFVKKFLTRLSRYLVLERIIP